MTAAAKRHAKTNPKTTDLIWMFNLLPRPFFPDLCLDGVDVQCLDVPKQVLPHRVVAKASVDHLVGGLRLRPAVVDDPIDCHHCPGTIRTVLAMHEHRLQA